MQHEHVQRTHTCPKDAGDTSPHTTFPKTNSRDQSPFVKSDFAVQDFDVWTARVPHYVVIISNGQAHVQVDVAPTVCLGPNCTLHIRMAFTFLGTTAQHTITYSLAHLAVPYGGRQDARLEPKYIQ
jgi:hypothetical protein